MEPDTVANGRETAKQAGKSAYRTALDIVLTGIVVILPLVVTLYILRAALGFIAGALEPVIRILEWAGLIEGVKQVGFVDFLITVGIYTDVVDFLSTLIAVLILLVLIVGIGFLARFRHGERLIDYFDHFVSTIPGVGSLYNSFRRMADSMLETGVENFQEVKLVEFPHDDVYVVGFKTSQSPGPVLTSAEETEMETLFLPLAPNPVMGGFLAHIPTDRVREVEMTVEEAVRTIITSGIAADGPDEEFRQLEPGELDELPSAGAPRSADSDPE
jgi:uncharacterized membrane protein